LVRLGVQYISYRLNNQTQIMIFKCLKRKSQAATLSNRKKRRNMP
jgi:hypothetical protein